MNSIYSGFVFFILVVVCSSVPLPRNPTDGTKDSVENAFRKGDVDTKPAETRPGVSITYAGLGPGKRHSVIVGLKYCNNVPYQLNTTSRRGNPC